MRQSYSQGQCQERRKMRIIQTVFSFVLLLSALYAQDPQIRPADLLLVTGSRWTGQLTYLDYTTKRPVSIPSTLSVTQVDGQPSAFIFDYQYPDEPHAKSTSTLTIADGGRTFSGERVVTRQVSTDGTLLLVTEKSGRDDGREALIRHTYQIKPGRFLIKKEVRFGDNLQFIQRSLYQWAR